MYKIRLLTILCLFVVSYSTHAEETQGMLEAHNQERAKHDLSPLSWSPSLVDYAQQWANHLAQTNQCNMQHRPQSGAFKQSYGENLYWASPVRWSNGKVEVQNIDGSKVVQDWASEKQYYNIRINQCFTGQQCGHYTQIVWEKTTQVGCAKTVCGDKSQVWVCNYNPPGNYIGQRPY